MRQSGVRALLAALTCEKGDLDANLAVHVATIARAARAGCALVVFPEFSLTGSVDPVHAPGNAITIDHPAIKTLVAATEPGVAAVFGFCRAVWRSVLHHPSRRVRWPPA